MKRLSRIVFLIGFLLNVNACKKENAKHEYEMTLFFETGDVWRSTGRIFEKDKRYKKYEEELKSAKDYFKIGSSNLVYIDCFDGIGVLKYDKKLGGGGKINNLIDIPVSFANNQTGIFQGTITMEGFYTQKGRAYTVETGTFQFYWSNAWSFGEFDTIINGTWSLKRK
jgi:hypothetical protein